MLDEVLEGLAVGLGKIFLDGTVGYGGHAQAILDRSSPDGRLIGLDRDPEALRASKTQLAPYGERVMLQQADYEQFDEVLRARSIDGVDGILLDLGVSSPQLTEARRGFGFRESGPLDMRMDPAQELSANEIINRWSVKDLERIFHEYGEEPFARRYARAIVNRRNRQPLSSTQELASIIRAACPKKGHMRIHPATRAFQALRIAVNRELEALETFLSKFLPFLRSGGRLAILSYHSLEDRRVKQCLRKGAQEEKLIVHTKKPLTPSCEELRHNSRARSAKLRIAEKKEL